MYEKCDIEEMLKKYLISKAQLEELDFKTNRNKVLLKYNGKIYRETDEEAIRELALKSPISDVPKGKTNKINRITENIALQYKEKTSYLNKVDRMKIINEININEKKAQPLRDLVGTVDRMLKALNNEQKLIVKNYYMYEQKWNFVSKTYIDIYNEPKTINQLKNIRDISLKIMLEVVNF